MGVKAGTPVCNAVGDNQASLLGSCPDMNSSILINLGTGGQISLSVPAFVNVPRMEIRYLPHGRCMSVGRASAAAGRSRGLTRWWGWVREFGAEPEQEAVYAKLCQLAASARPAGGLTARTTLAARRTHGSAVDSMVFRWRTSRSRTWPGQCSRG